MRPSYLDKYPLGNCSNLVQSGYADVSYKACSSDLGPQLWETIWLIWWKPPRWQITKEVSIWSSWMIRRATTYMPSWHRSRDASPCNLHLIYECIVLAFYVNVSVLFRVADFCSVWTALYSGHDPLLIWTLWETKLSTQKARRNRDEIEFQLAHESSRTLQVGNAMQCKHQTLSLISTDIVLGIDFENLKQNTFISRSQTCISSHQCWKSCAWAQSFMPTWIIRGSAATEKRALLADGRRHSQSIIQHSLASGALL